MFGNKRDEEEEEVAIDCRREILKLNPNFSWKKRRDFEEEDLCCWHYAERFRGYGGSRRMKIYLKNKEMINKGVDMKRTRGIR